MKNFTRIAAGLVLVSFLTACSSDGTQTGSKSKTDLYLISRMQENSISIYDRSEVRRMDLKENFFTTSDAGRKRNITQLIERGEQFDEALEKLIHQIETAKLEIVKQSGADLNANGVIKYEPKNLVSKYQFIDVDPAKNISLNFNFAELGKEQSELMYEFRKNILVALLNNSIGADNKPFTFSDPNIRNTNSRSFLNEVEKAFSGMKISPDDSQVSESLYIMATPNESFYQEAFKEDIHWIEKFALLEDQKQKLLDIRQLFYLQLGSKISLAAMVDFNSIIAVAEGNEYVEGGSEQNFNVYLAGINGNEQPVLTVNGVNSSVNIQDGVAKVKVIVPKGASECEYAGTISIRDKTGQVIQRKWSKKFVISK